MSDRVSMRAFAILGVCALVLFLLHYGTFWPSASPKSCIYRPLKDRYCEEFPNDGDLTVLGAKWPALSSLMFVFGGLAGLRLSATLPLDQLRGHAGEILFVGIYVIWLGIVSYQYHSTHCTWYWRADINTSRAFPYVIALALAFVCGPAVSLTLNAVKAGALAIPVAVFMSVYWSNTNSTALIIALGSGILAFTLAFALRIFDGKLSVLMLTLCLVIGGGFIVGQAWDKLCPAQPVAIGHTVLGFTYPLLINLLSSKGNINAPVYTSFSPDKLAALI